MRQHRHCRLLCVTARLALCCLSTRSGVASDAPPTVSAVVDATAAQGRFGPLCYGVGVRGLPSPAALQRFAEAGGDLVRFVPPENGWQEAAVVPLAAGVQALQEAGVLSLISLGGPDWAEAYGRLGGRALPEGVLFEVPAGYSVPGSAAHGRRASAEAGSALPAENRLRVRLGEGVLPAVAWPQFSVVELPAGDRLERGRLETALAERAGSEPVVPVLMCYPVSAADTAPTLFDWFCRLTETNAVGIAPTFAGPDPAEPQFAALLGLTRLLGQTCEMRHVRLSVSAPEPLKAVAGRYAGGVAVAASGAGDAPLSTVWSIALPRGSYMPRSQLLDRGGRWVADTELPPMIANGDRTALTVRAALPADHVLGLRLTDHSYLAYRTMGDLQAQLNHLPDGARLSSADSRLLLLPLADARRGIANLLAPVRLTSSKVQFWSHQALLRLAQVELSVRNLGDSGRLPPLTADALSGEVLQAIEHLSSASSAGFGLLLAHEILPAAGRDGERRVRVRVKSLGGAAVQRVRLGVTSDAGVAISAVGRPEWAQLRPGRSLTAEFSLQPREGIACAECRATLSYSALRSFARRSQTFRVEWPQVATSAEAGPDA